MVRRRCPECDRLEIDFDAHEILLSKALRDFANADTARYEAARVALSDAKIDADLAQTAMEQHRRKCRFWVTAIAQTSGQRS